MAITRTKISTEKQATPGGQGELLVSNAGAPEWQTPAELGLLNEEYADEKIEEVREEAQASSAAALNEAKEYTDGVASGIAAGLNNKVDKEFGKGLSANDYSSAEKTRLASIEPGAQVNVKSDWDATSGDAEILNKPTIPSTTGLATEAQVQDVQDNLDAHEADTANPHSVTKAQVGLGNADNTSDADKPVSTAQQAALDGKADISTVDTYLVPYQSQKLLSQFNLSEWSKQSSGGSIAQNTTDFISGAESLEMITPATANGSIFADKSIPATDMTNAIFRVAVKCSDYTRFNGIWCDIGDSSMSNFFRVNVVQDPRSLRDGDWNYITFSSADLRSTTGSPSWTNITKLRLRVNAAGSASASVLFDILTYSIAESKPRLLITFDDGYKTDISVAKPIMDSHGFVGTSYVIRDKIGTGGTRMTLEDLKSLQRCNWSIGSHGSPDLTTLTKEQLKAEFEDITQYLKSNGLSGYNNYAYPMGRYNSLVTSVADRYFKTARTIHVQPETTIPAERLKLRVFYVINSTTNSQLQGEINRANRNGITLILVFHRIVSTTSEPEDVSIANFTTFMQTIASSGIPVTNIEMAYK